MPPGPPNQPNPEENQPNPFADDLPDQPYRDDPFASPQSGGYEPNAAGHYDAMAPPRSGAILALAITGLVVALAGSAFLYCCLPANVLGLAFSLPAWAMARNDLLAMKLGAMDPDAEARTRTARLLAVIGVVVAGLPLAVVLVLMLLNVGSDSMLEFRRSLGF